ncbi:MAG: response regulator transcription factor [Ignavibacteria bacterium]|nr:response regulator transcription factor [Ignavibacteria bacterium]
MYHHEVIESLKNEVKRSFAEDLYHNNFYISLDLSTMNQTNSILIIEDDTAISIGLKDMFKEELYDVTVAKDGAVGLKYSLSRTYDCIILDLMLPTMNGREVCKAIRAAGNTTPILMLTSRNAESDMILGLEIGADDYMSKPFSIRELMARVRALLRRTQNHTEPIIDVSNEIKIGSIIINIDKREMISNGIRQKLLSKEVEILEFFLKNEG